jgi:hypothetical protein
MFVVISLVAWEDLLEEVLAPLAQSEMASVLEGENSFYCDRGIDTFGGQGR